MTYEISFQDFNYVFSGIANPEIIRGIYYKDENHAQQPWIYWTD